MITWQTALLIAAAIALVGLGLAEALARLLGYSQFLLYAPDPASTYRMAAHQSGRLRNRTDWRYDANGMRHDAAPPSFAGMVLLVGDSIVDCSAKFAQQDTLAACLERALVRPVYPVAAPGWSLGNALGALAALPGWNQASEIVLLLNDGDFDYDAEASSVLGFPMRRPWLVSVFLVRRTLFLRSVARRARIEGTARLPRDAALRVRNLARLRDLAAATGARFAILHHPMCGAGADFDGYYGELAAAAEGRLLHSAAAAGWSNACYSDNLHLSVQGARVLAAYLAQQLVKP